MQLLIDGQLVDAKSGKTFESEDPRTGKLLVEVAEAQEEDVDLAVKAARKVTAFSSSPNLRSKMQFSTCRDRTMLAP